VISTESITTWTDANQAYLIAEFASLASRLSRPEDRRSEELAAAERHAATIRADLQPPPAIDYVAEQFSLSEFERQLLLLCAGVEMDSRLAAACAEAQDSHKAQVTFGLAMALLDEPHWGALTPTRPLRRLRMIEVQPNTNLTSASIRIDERVLHYLAGLNLLDPRLDSLLRASRYPDWIADEHRQIADELTAVLEGCPETPPIFHLCGDDPRGQEDVAALVAHQLRAHPFSVRMDELPPVGPELELFTVLWEREAALLRGALLVQCGAAGLTPSARRLLEHTPGMLFLCSREPVSLERNLAFFDVNKPSPAEQRRVWSKALGESSGNMNDVMDDISEQFRFSARTIYSTASLLKTEDRVLPDRLWDACRLSARPRLEDLALRIVPCATWDELVLPALQRQMLRTIAAQVRHRMKVYETWGFSAKGRRGLGVSALFTGASGTGKTMAAEVLAHDLRLDLYRIDLSAVVSKYIGETEKNLKQVFDAAEDGGVLLLFDEADALFGKRSEVRDSHDRYANIEVGYLLQKIEAYQGLAILTTNLRASLDTSFQRRLRFTVDFPFPDAKQREAIWQKIFPEATPTKDLDPKRLAQLNVAGGSIRNVALNAAFLAANSGTPVQMTHLLEAAKLESLKIDRPLSDAELRGWVA
jgi:hypothetical protein